MTLRTPLLPAPATPPRRPCRCASRTVTGSASSNRPSGIGAVTVLPAAVGGVVRVRVGQRLRVRVGVQDAHDRVVGPVRGGLDPDGARPGAQSGLQGWHGSDQLSGGLAGAESDAGAPPPAVGHRGHDSGAGQPDGPALICGHAANVRSTRTLARRRRWAHHGTPPTIVRGQQQRQRGSCRGRSGRRRGYPVAVVVPATGWLTAATHTAPARLRCRCCWWLARSWRHPLVDPPAPPRQGPRGAHPRRLAADHRGRRAARVPSHVRRGRPLGVARPHRPATGQTPTDLINSAPALESGLHTRPGAVRVEPDPDRADHVIVRVLTTDPHARPLPYPPGERTRGPDSHRADPARAVRGRRPGHGAARTPSRPHRWGRRRRQERCPQRHPRRTRRLPRRRALGRRPQGRHGAAPVGRLPRPARHHPRPGDGAARRRRRRARVPRPAARRRRVPAVEPTAAAPALIVVIDEYAELADEVRGGDRARRLRRPPRAGRRRHAARRDPAADAEGDGLRRRPLPDGRPDLPARPRTPRRRPHPRPRHARRRLGRRHPQRARQVPHLHPGAHHPAARPRLPRRRPRRRHDRRPPRRGPAAARRPVPRRHRSRPMAGPRSEAPPADMDDPAAALWAALLDAPRPAARSAS